MYSSGKKDGESVVRGGTTIVSWSSSVERCCCCCCVVEVLLVRLLPSQRAELDTWWMLFRFAFLRRDIFGGVGAKGGDVRGAGAGAGGTGELVCVRVRCAVTLALFPGEELDCIRAPGATTFTLLPLMPLLALKTSLCATTSSPLVTRLTSVPARATVPGKYFAMGTSAEGHSMGVLDFQSVGPMDGHRSSMIRGRLSWRIT